MVIMSSSLDLSDAENERIRTVIREYAAIYREIDFEDRPEPDVVPRLIRHLFINVLGHDESDYEQENDWNDIIFRDDDGNAVIVVEAKRRSVDVEEGREQGFEYCGKRNYVEYFVSTNIDKFHLYKTCNEDEPDAISHGGYTARPIATINFEALVNSETGRALTSAIDINEYQNILELNKLRREEVANVSKFDQFNIPATQIESVSDDEGFDNLLDALEKAINEYFMPYTLKRFDQYKERHSTYKNQHEKLENELDKVQSGETADEEEVAELRKQISEVAEEWEPYRRFWEDYEVWKQLSNRVGEVEAENKRIFCRESVYTQINKILFIRIAEDKGLLNTMVSNGGVHDYFNFWKDYAKYTGPQKDYRDLFNAACTEMMDLYEHLFSGSIFDWELRDGSALNEVFQKTFWHLNHYDFEEVDRDVLGSLYEQHLPKEERQTLGEFYTPTEVVNFILDRVEYTADRPIENKDVLDPATGSGTFLVQAANRLVERLENKGVEPKSALEIVQKRLHGLDINPFAVNIAQINLVFQVIDLYRDVKESHPEYTIDNFQIYQTDSLKRSSETKLSGFHSNTVIRKYQQDKEKADSVKSGDYDLVIGNPPYVNYNEIPEGQRETYNSAFAETSAHRQYDMSILFIDSAREWLDQENGGKLAYITSNKFTINQYGSLLRKTLPRKLYVDEFIDFADADVFEDATNYPCVFVMRRKTEDEEVVIRSESEMEEPNLEEYNFPFVKVKKSMADNTALLNHIRQHLGTEYEDEYINAFPVSSLSLEENSWKFIPEEESKILNAIQDGADDNYSVDDLCKYIESGVKPGKLEAYLVSDEEIEQHQLEEEYIHPVLRGQDISRWRTPTPQQNMIYITSDDDPTNFENILSYLQQYKSDLEERTQVDTWWEIREPRPSATTNNKKVASPKIFYYTNFTVLSGEGYPTTGVYYGEPKNEVDLNFLLGLTNSIVMQFYVNQESPKYRGSYLQCYGNIWGALPVTRDSKIENEIAAKTQEIREFIDDQKRADEILNNPAMVFEEFDVETLPLREHPAVESFSLGDEDFTSPVLNGTTVEFESLSAEINFFDGNEKYTELFMNLISMKSFGVVEELEDVPLPDLDGDLDAILTELEEVRKDIETAGEQMRELQDELDDLVLDMYGFDKENKRLIKEYTESPTNPLDTRVVKD